CCPTAPPGGFHVRARVRLRLRVWVRARFRCYGNGGWSHRLTLLWTREERELAHLNLDRLDQREIVNFKILHTTTDKMDLSWFVFQPGLSRCPDFASSRNGFASTGHKTLAASLTLGANTGKTQT